MTLKPLALACLALTISACTTTPKKQTQPKAPEQVVFVEPEISPPFYALNPLNYNEPPPFEVHLQKAAAQPVTKMVVTNPNDPSKQITLEVNKLIIPIVDSKTAAVRYSVLAGENEFDVTEIDDFLQLVEGKARHYPPRFSDRQERRGFEAKLREVSQQLDTLAARENASFDVLMRAFKASVMARNLDLGSIYTTKSLTYAQRILRMNPEDPEVNFWFGFGLSEGGGHREAIQYLDKAMKAGVQEAYLSAKAQDIKSTAKTKLQKYLQKKKSQLMLI